MSYSKIKDSDVEYVFNFLFATDEAKTEFMDLYLDYVDYDWTLDYFDEDGTAHITVSTCVLRVYDLVERYYHDHDLSVAAFAATYADADHAGAAINNAEQLMIEMLYPCDGILV